MTEAPVFIDTSGIYAVLDRDDSNHGSAARNFDALLDAPLMRTHSYVIVELAALVQARLGMAAARVLHDDIVPLIDVRWVDEHLHRRSVAAVLAARRSSVSFVDWCSFEVMREEGLTTAFSFDRHFRQQGFHLLAD
jgi:uncharacterized protein